MATSQEPKIFPQPSYKVPLWARRGKQRKKMDDNVTEWTVRSFTATQTLTRNQHICTELVRCSAVILWLHLIMRLMWPHLCCCHHSVLAVVFSRLQMFVDPGNPVTEPFIYSSLNRNNENSSSQEFKQLKIMLSFNF